MPKQFFETDHAKGSINTRICFCVFSFRRDSNPPVSSSSSEPQSPLSRTRSSENVGGGADRSLVSWVHLKVGVVLSFCDF